ncbi:sialidase family protein [Ereboglobus luteus]|uniref:Sialidase n=1 Tax=Ereboglobus luteus TaxID=1796921 RepID=A0A2U8E336_9BACT|nr:sialidase family protein [Ereboglobus luteus]AWI09289.1 sialidase [Ereboglobus luteus]
MNRKYPASLIVLMAVFLMAPGVAAENSAPMLRSEFIYKEAPYPECHASTIAQTAGGTMVASWFGGTKEKNPDVCIWVSRLENDKWTEPVNVANGIQPDGTRHPTWNPVLLQAPGKNAPLILYYKVGPSPQKWWGMQMISKDGGRSWEEPTRLPEGILGPIKNKPVVLPDGTWISPSSTEARRTDWQVHFEISKDQGNTWRKAGPVKKGAGFDAIQPSVLVMKDGRLEALCRTRQGVIAMTWSADNGETWSPLSALALPNPNSGTDAVTLSDGRQLLIYNHSAHRADRSGRGVRYPLKLALSDDGLNWTPVLTLEDQPLPEGYAYPAIIQTSDGLVHITYTWDRKRIKYTVIDPSKL